MALWYCAEAIANDPECAASFCRRGRAP